LIEELFGKYGKVWITKKNKMGARNIGVGLSPSFSFLLGKSAGKWIFEDRDCFFSFLAGFTDAEGHIGVSGRGMAVYALGNYDRRLLQKIRKALLSFGIDCRDISVSMKKGYVGKEG